LFDPGADRPIAEHDTFTCGHCQRIVVVPAKCSPAELGGVCGHCNAMICPRCVASGVCVPWEEAMRRMEAKTEALRSYGLGER